VTIPILQPDWPAPPGVRAISTLRGGGVSSGPFASLNLGLHVGDDPVCVRENRRLLVEQLALPSEPSWLSQVHGNRCMEAGFTDTPKADASLTDRPGIVCAVMTADCLPLLICKGDGSAVAAVHAGWRGLANGVIESTIATLKSTDILVWLGPAIGPDAFEVGAEVRDIFVDQDPALAGAFRAQPGDRFLADIYRIARSTLKRLGVAPENLFGGDWCTYHQADQFFSYRRDGATGRMASLIWREPIA
jgi:YfiH family protein